ncbi:MAG: FecR domain-containing protein [Acidobacteriota bacterium]|nr:FecR domain-containing protein [Acidobacteriota bacterium]
MQQDDQSYIWNKTGEPDPELLNWERQLSGFSARSESLRALSLPERAKNESLRMASFRWIAAAACLLLSAFAILRIAWQPGRDWKVTTVSGVPLINNVPMRSGRRLSAGELLQTDDHSRAMLRMGLMAKIEVGPATKIRLLTTGSSQHRISLQSGKITARVWAPPFTILVDTPAATTVDLGCAFTLQVEERGSGELHVTSGWVESERNKRQAIIPAGAMVLIRPAFGPGTPFFEDAGSRFRGALEELDFGKTGYRNIAALELLLSEARRRDAITLLSLLRRVQPSEKGLVFDRAAEFVPAPLGLTRADVVHGTNQHGIDEWWRKLGLGEAKSWLLNWRDIVTS